MIVKKHCFTTAFNVGDLVAVKEEYHPSSFDKGTWRVETIHIKQTGISYSLSGVDCSATTGFYEDALYLISE